MNLRYAWFFLVLGEVLYFTMLNPHFFWWFVGIGTIFMVLSIGLHHRTRWMWYLGWVFMFVLSGAMGGVFVIGMVNAPDVTHILRGVIYLGVGLAIWVPAAVWWSTHSGDFGSQKGTPTSAPPNSTAPEKDA